MRRNYTRGYEKEVRCVKELRESGYWAERNYASKGTFDVVASNHIHTLLIQVKRSKRWIADVQSIANAYRDDLELMMKVPRHMLCHVQLWVWFDASYVREHYRKAGWRYFEVTPEGIFEIQL